MYAQSPPDLTATGAIAALKANTSADPGYNETYNLGPTGLRGWIHVGGGNGADGTITDQSRQILVTVASAPGNAVLAVDDVILGAMAGNSGTVPDFTSDCRKAFGVAIGEAEKTGAGTLRVKRWRANTITEVNIPMTIMGDYTATAPYSCPKSSLILTNARNKLVSQLLADPNFFTNGYEYARSISGLALLAGVQFGDPDYATVQTRLQTYARALSTAGPQQGGLPVWQWAYSGIFLAEYYLSTNDANVLPGIASYTNILVQSQSIYGTFGHDPGVLRPDGSGRRINIGYGPVNSVGIVANMAILMGKKALLAGGQTISPEIDTAIQRGSDYFAWYVNKGTIPYGEHGPWLGNHESNGKDPMCAVFFGLQSDRAPQTEYFTRMSIAGFNSRESGHTGQGFSYLWGAMGANVGGSLATAEYLKNVRWHLDLSRRTDGSFVYDGREGWGPGSTANGTYLGASGYNGINATASYILTYALPLQRLHITGKNANPANTLDSIKVAHAISAATFKQDSPGLTNTQLITALSDFDPVVRHYAAIELGKRTLLSGELTTLRGMVTGTDANGRMGACQALGLLQDATALPSLVQRLDKNIETNSWVRSKAASSLRSYSSSALSIYRDTLLTAFAANATDPDAINWDDPIQISNGSLAQAVFGNGVPDGTPGNDIASYTVNAPKNLLYTAVTAGLKQPDSYPRTGVAKFCFDRLPLADVQALIPDFFELIENECQADRMWSADSRGYGIKTLGKHKIREGIPLALSLLDVPAGFEWGAPNYMNPALDWLETYGDAARWTLPSLNNYLAVWNPQDTSYPQQVYPNLVSTAAGIEAAITAPAQNLGLAVANPQVVATTAAKAITLTGTSPRSAVTFANVTAPAHGTLTGTAPNLTYTPDPGYSGPDSFTFEVVDDLTTSEPGTVSIIVGAPGTGLVGEYFDNADFTNLKLTRTDAQVNFDWGTGSPDPLIGADTFSVRWSGLLLVPETGTYTFSTLNSDGVRLYVDGVAVLNEFSDQNTNWNDSASIHLTKGHLVDLQMDYDENTGSAVAKLKWTGPSFAGANGLPIAKEWMYQSSNLRFAYAHAQSVNVQQDTPQPITLTGSGAASASLIYTIVTQPTHGTLSGTAPNLIYTPATSYSGTDSFTFRVNNGTMDSDPATVSIHVTNTQTSQSFFWTNPVSGNWSGASSWTNALGGAVTLAASGQADYVLNFDQPGTYTTTHDLNTGFAFNQLNFSGAVTISGTSSLSSTVNGSVPPQINQNSSGVVSVDTPVILAANTAFGGTGGGRINLTGLISGAGSLTKNGSGRLDIYGITTNTFTGGATINSGTLHLGAVIDGLSPTVVNPLGTGPVTLNGGIIDFDKVTAANALTVNGGTLYCNNGWGATWSGPVTLNATAAINTVFNITLSGTLSGTGGINKTGDNTLILSGTNSFTGDKNITAGTLSCTRTAALGTGVLTIGGGAMVNLGYSRNSTPPVVNGLVLGGVAQAPGTYGSSASSATNKSDTWFSGSGKLTVLPSSSTALALTAGSSPSANGASLTFRATVTGASPSGSVTFHDGNTLLGTSTLNGSAQATFTTSSLANGAHSITARYAGNNANAPSTSAPLTIGVLPAAPTILATNATTNTVGLLWTHPAGATEYHLKRSLTNGGPYTLVAVFSANQFVDATVTDGTDYHYVVSALNEFGEGSVSGQVSVSTLENFVPVANAQELLTDEDAALPITLSATDANGDPLTYAVVSPPAHGDLSGTPPDLTYTPAANYHGADSFTFKASDGNSDSTPATVTLSITSVNDPPVFAANPIILTNAGEEVAYTGQTLSGLATDADPGDTITWSKVSGPAWLAVASDGTLTGTPPLGTVGLNTFVVRASDPVPASATATLQITVTSAGPITTLTSTTNSSGSGGTLDNWNQTGNWSAGIPSGSIRAILSGGLTASVYSTSTPAYSGGLTMGNGSLLKVLDQGNGVPIAAANALGTGTIILNSSTIDIQSRDTVNIPPIGLLGNGKITASSSSGDSRTRNLTGTITGAGQFTIEGRNKQIWNVTQGNAFSGGLALTALDRYIVNFNAPGSAGTGDVTVTPRPTNTPRSAVVVLGANNVFSETATLTLNGKGNNDGTGWTYTGDVAIDMKTFHATVARLIVGGVEMPVGNYTGTSGAWIQGTGTLTVAGTYETWISRYDVGTLTGLTDDPDLDGKPNYLEFALNSNPADGSSGGMPTARLTTIGGTPNVLTLTVAVRSGAIFSPDGNNQKAIALADGLTYQIEASNLLNDWGTPVVTEVTGADATAIHASMTPPAPEFGWTYHTFRTDGNVGSQPKSFIRVRVTHP